MFLRKQEMLDSVDVLFDRIRQGCEVYDGISSRDKPVAPVWYYASLAALLTKLIRGDPNEREAEVFLFRLLPIIESIMLIRRETISKYPDRIT